MTTQFARASYQEIIDLHTESDKVSVIGIHTPVGMTPRKMFGGFFEQFKKFKYLGCSISLVPAARLPADPLQVSYEAGDLTIDPRDMLNPIMFHGCHGNDMGVILNRLYALNSLESQDGKFSDSIFQLESEQDINDATSTEGFLFGSQLESLYYKALTDNTWKKAHPQRGFRKSGLRPLVYSMATNMQFNGTIEQSAYGIPDPVLDIDYSNGNSRMTLNMPVTQGGRKFFTPRLTGLGWLDTRNVMTLPAAPYDDRSSVTEAFDFDDILQAGTVYQQNASEADLPLVYMGMILMPPAYKTEQYFRMIVHHHFAFKDFRGISFSNDLMETPAYSNFNDEDYSGGSDDPVVPDDPTDPDDPDEPTPDDPDEPTYNGAYVSSLSTIGSDPVYLELYDTLNGTPILLATFDNSGSTKAGIWCDENMVPHPVLVLEGGATYIWKKGVASLGWYQGSSIAGAAASNIFSSGNWEYQDFGTYVEYDDREGAKSRVQQICNGTENVQVLP